MNRPSPLVLNKLPAPFSNAAQYGIELSPSRGLFSVILPEATQNLDSNPSFEIDLTGYTAAGSTLTRVATYQRHGIYSCKVDLTAGANQGVYYSVSLVAGTTYTFSFDFLGRGGTEYTIALYDNTPTLVNSQKFVATGYWDRPSFSFTQLTTATMRLYVIQAISDAHTFYTDGWQIEAKDHATTYCDGNQVGLLDIAGTPAYSWDGSANQSTSQRSATTRAGGRIVDLLDYGFHVTSYTGLGNPPLNVISIDYALLPGSQYQRTRTLARNFALVGSVFANGTAELRQHRLDLVNAFNSDSMSEQQPLLLQYEPLDESCNKIGNTRLIECVYLGGLEGITDNYFQEKIAIKFVCNDPPYVIDGGDIGYVLTGETSISPSYIALRDALGQWKILGTGITGGSHIVHDIVIAPDGGFYIIGDFTTAGGVACANIAKYNKYTNTFTALGSGLGADGEAGTIGPDGKLYVVGSFTTAGGGAAKRVAVWDGSTWAAVGAGFDAIAYDIEFSRDGTLYAGGSFVKDGAGVVTLNGIAKLSSGAWAAIGTGVAGGSARVDAIKADKLSSNVYVSGSFTTANGVTVNYVTYTDGTTFYSMGGGLGGTAGAGPANAMVTDSLGMVLGGTFTSAGGVTAKNIARWGGYTWSVLGSGIGTAGLPSANDMTIGPSGEIYVVGPDAQGVVTPNRSSIWNGSAWIPFDTAMGAAIYAVVAGADGTLVIATPENDARYIAGITSVNNIGNADSYPIVKITSDPAYLYELRNFTTGDALYFSSLYIQSGEIITIDFTPGVKSITSNFRGNLQSYLIPGSNIATWKLLPGVNSISLFVNSSTTAIATTATLQFRPQYQGLE